MSIELVEEEIRRFLSTTEPEVLCISGRWGVGKTYAWKRYLTESQAQRKVALQYYSYVSLFGVDSLDTLKYSIFENSVPATEQNAEPSLKATAAKTKSWMAMHSKRLFGFAQGSSFAQHYLGGLGPMCFFSVKETIVCLDDIERRGGHLSIRDVLGLVSLLKEQKRCKVIMILNDEALAEGEKEFNTYFEKVVDARLTFAPSAEEAARIAIATDNEVGKLLSESCVALGIENIRLIKKIERAVIRVEPLLEGFEKAVLKKAVRSLALFGWSVYEPNRAPTLDYLTARSPGLVGIRTKGDIPPNEAAWNALLATYGFTEIDEFDLILLLGIQKGYFDSSSVQKCARELNERTLATQSGSSFHDAWRLYHETFENNETQVIATIYQAFTESAKYLSLLDLNGTVWLLKGLAAETQASDCIRRYIESHGESRRSFDLANYPFKERVDDPDVILALNKKCESLKEKRNPRAILLSIADTNGWNEEDVTWLSTLPISEYRKLFKESNGGDLLKIIDACLQFDRFANGTVTMAEISKRAKDALKSIGEESRINALRVAKYGGGVASLD
jgi:hypothetical protein